MQKEGKRYRVFIKLYFIRNIVIFLTLSVFPVIGLPSGGAHEKCGQVKTPWRCGIHAAGCDRRADGHGMWINDFLSSFGSVKVGYRDASASKKEKLAKHL